MLTQTNIYLGEVEFERKNYQVALYHWRMALEESQLVEGVDLFIKADIHFKIGQAHDQIGESSKALHSYDQAAALLENADRLQDIAKVYLSMAVSYKQIGNYDKSVEYSERAIGSYDSLNTLLMSTKLQMTRAAFLTQSGQVEQAVAEIETCIERFEELGDREEQGIAWVDLAKLLVQLNAMQRTEKALVKAKELLPREHFYYAWLNYVSAHVAIKQDDLVGALSQFYKAADIFKQHNALGDWADTMNEISAIYMKQQDTEKAIAVLGTVNRHTRQVLAERGIVL